jgi:hypothetical protein
MNLAMNINTQKTKEKLQLIMNLITKVADKRKDSEVIIQLSLLNFEIGLTYDENINKHLPEFKNSLFDIIDKIKFTINAEERYVLFPLPDIKKQTYEIGKNYMKNFFDWLKPEDDYSPEQLMKIFEDELYSLKEAKELLEKL